VTDFENTLLKLNMNLNSLREREARYAGQTPPALLNQIADHQQAIALTEQAIANEITVV
jgi:hypothetical protein